MGLDRILILLLMGVLWPLAWAGKGVKILLSARTLQEPRLLHVSGPVQIARYRDAGHILQVGGHDFDLEGNPSGLILEGDEYTIHYLEATDEILSVEPSMHAR